MLWKTSNKLRNRLLGGCFNDPGSAGADGGGGGGGGGAPASAPAATSPAQAPTAPSGQHSAPDAGHSFTPAAGGPSASQIQAILGKEKDPNHTLSVDEIRQMLAFNPPLGGAAPPAQTGAHDPAATPPAGAQPPAGQTPPAAATPTPGQPAIPAQPTPQEALVAALREAFPQGSQPAPQPAQTPGQTPAPEQKPYYGGHTAAMEVSPELSAALFSGDPAVAAPAMNVLVNGMMNKVFTDMTGLMVAQQRQFMAQLPQLLNNFHNDRANTDKFYTMDPVLDKPVLKPVVANIGQAMAAAYAKAGKPVWDQQFFKDLSVAVRSYVKTQLNVELPPPGGGQTPVVVQPPAPVAPVATPAPAPANGHFYSNGGVRPPATPGGYQSADLISFVL